MKISHAIWQPCHVELPIAAYAIHSLQARLLPLEHKPKTITVLLLQQWFKLHENKH